MSQEIKLEERDRVMTPTGHAGEVKTVIGRNVEVRTINGTETYHADSLSLLNRAGDPIEAPCRDGTASQSDSESKSVTITSHRDLGDANMSHDPKYKCVECGEFTVNLTCSSKCRQRRRRRRQQARLALPLAMYELGKIRDSIKRRERVPDFVEDLKRLKAEINDLLLLAGERDALEKQQMLYDRSRRTP